MIAQLKRKTGEHSNSTIRKKQLTPYETVNGIYSQYNHTMKTETIMAIVSDLRSLPITKVKDSYEFHRYRDLKRELHKRGVKTF
jgi:hypothetical protein